jgi:glycosyltransferase involved in cell wall biosynthesis
MKRVPNFLRSYVNPSKTLDWVCISESKGWVIAEEAKFISQCFESQGKKSRVVYRPDLIKNNILHYCSLHTYGLRYRSLWVESNKQVLTCFHGDFGINSEMDLALGRVLADKDKIDALIVSCSLMRKRFIDWRISSSKLHLIPISVDKKLFSPDFSSAEHLRENLGIPVNSIVIGSFQKDGVGFDDGLIPKMIKGPDIFCDVVERLNNEFPIVVLLTGPARGYVKKRLEEAGVRYIHFYEKNPKNIAKYYKALDLYLMTSREEGGPKSLLESLFSGIPFVGTDVGMVNDVLFELQANWVCSVGDVDALFDSCKKIILDRNSKARASEIGMYISKFYDHDAVSKMYINLYNQLSEKLA